MRLKLQTCLTFRRDAEERLLLLEPAVSSSAVLKSCTSWSMLCTSSLSVSLAGIISCPPLKCVVTLLRTGLIGIGQHNNVNVSMN